jgi:sporulation protein YhbH
MAIIVHDDWDLSEKGKKDAERHREKIDDAIRKNVKDVISEESIITKRKGKKVRIPVRGMRDYRFIYGSNDGAAGGVGQDGTGKGKAGDVIDSRPKPGQGKDGDGGDKAGDQAGIDYMETEVDIDYLIEIMFQDLGLPWIEEKTKKQQLIPKGWKFETISKKGIQPRIHKKRTLLEAIKRMVMFEAEIMNDTGCDEMTAKRALIQTMGDLVESIELVKANKVDNTIDPTVQIEDDDLRYKQIEPDMEVQSQAVVICMMDVSGSMTTDKKYLARSMLFWLTEFLKKCYDNVQIKFITHTTEAQVVDEDTFFHKGESGGTACWTAFDKANYIIDTEFPVAEWNVYCVYISDGEDWDPKKTVRYMDEMLKKNVNMLSYIEIAMDSGPWGWSDESLLKEIRSKWDFSETSDSGTKFYKNNEHRFLLSIIKSRDHVYPALKHMLFEKRS